MNRLTDFFFSLVNLQMTQVGGANSLKLSGPPSLPSGSANGVTRITSFNNSKYWAIVNTVLILYQF